MGNIFFDNFIFTIYYKNVAPLDSSRQTPLITRYCLTFYTWAEVCKNWLVTFCLIEFNRSFDTTICSSCHVCWVRTWISIKTKKNVKKLIQISNRYFAYYLPLQCSLSLKVCSMNTLLLLGMLKLPWACAVNVGRAHKSNVAVRFKSFMSTFPSNNIFVII